VSFPKPLIVAAFRPDATLYGVKVGAGSVQAFNPAYWYFGVSGQDYAGNRESFLFALKTALDASAGGGQPWTVTMTTDFHIVVTANDGGAHTIHFLNSASADSAAHGLIHGASSATVITVAIIGGFAIFPYRPRWLWYPNLPVNETGPERFDPTTQVGIPIAAGTVQRSQDGTVVVTDNGVNYDAEYEFKSVAGPSPTAYNIRPDPAHPNLDLEGFWKFGPSRGNRILWFRNALDATGDMAPDPGSGSPWKCIEYAVTEELKNNVPAASLTPYTLAWWNCRFKLSLTEQGEAPPMPII